MSCAPMGAHPDTCPAEITHPRPHSKQGRTGLQSVRGRLGYRTAIPAHAELSGGGAGPTVGSGLGREHLMETMTHLVVIKPGGKETVKQTPYDKEWERVALPGPGTHEAVIAGLRNRFPALPSPLGSLHPQTSVLILCLPFCRTQNCTILLFFKLFSQTVHFLSPRCIIHLQAISTRSVMPCSASGAF